MATNQILSFNVSETLSPKMRPLLYLTSIWKNGVTFTDNYVESGQAVIYVNKLVQNTSKDPKTRGTDFTHRESATDQKMIMINNVFQESDKVRNIIVSQIASDTALAEKVMENVLRSANENFQKSFTAKIAKTSMDTLTTTSGGGTAYVDEAAITTYDEFKESYRKAWKHLKDNKVDATFMIVSTSIYSILVSSAMGNEYMPSTIEHLNATGIIGKYRGLDVICANVFNETAVKYVKDDNTLSAAVDLSEIDFIMSAPEWIQGGIGLEMARFIQAIDFNGSLAQLEMATGFTIMDLERVLVRKTKA